jgi:hypothetical protein
MRQIFLALTILLLGAVAAEAQSAPAVAPDADPLPVPVLEDVIPPPVPERPLPLPPAAGSLAAPVLPKPALAWRAKAQELRTDEQAACRVVNGSYDAALMALVACLPQFGLRLESLNSDAGELLAGNIDGANPYKLIFVINEMPPDTVTIKAAPLSGPKSSAAVAQNVLRSLNPSIASRGTL